MQEVAALYILGHIVFGIGKLAVLIHDRIEAKHGDRYSHAFGFSAFACIPVGLITMAFVY